MGIYHKNLDTIIDGLGKPERGNELHPVPTTPYLVDSSSGTTLKFGDRVGLEI